MANLIGTWLNNVGTAIGAPELGWSEKYGVTSQNSPMVIGPESGMGGGTVQPIQGSSNLQYIPQAKGQSIPTPTQMQSVPQNQSTGGNSGFSMSNYAGWDPTAALADFNATGGKQAQSNPQADYMNQMLGLIGQNENDLMGGLMPSRDAQLNQANMWGTQQTNDLNANVQSNVGDLNTQIGKTEQGQVKTLKDVADNIRNLMQAGNTYLGARGAGDSSAVNQYAYGLTKLGSQQRGDVMSQTKNIIADINGQIAKVNMVATQEKNRIQSEVGQKTQEIAQWFADQQTNIKSAANKDKQALATNLYNQAVSQLSQLQNYAQSRQAQIESWALSNSTTAKEALAKVQQYGQFQAPGQQYSPISGNINTDAGGNMSSAFRGGGTGNATQDEYLKRLLGQ